MLPQDSKFNKWASIEKMVYLHANRVYARVEAAGLTGRVSLDDLVQEGAVVWIKAKMQFDPDRGVAFSTYLYNALTMSLNRFMKQQGHKIPSVSIDDESVYEELQEKHIKGSPERSLMAEDSLQAKLKELTPRGRLVLEWLVLPPDWLREEQAAMLEQGNEQVKRGYTKRPPVAQDLPMIMTVLKRVWGLTGLECQRLSREVRGVTQ